jgi:predicted transcriptional regulator
MYKLGIIEETILKKMKNIVAEGTVELEERSYKTAA